MKSTIFIAILCLSTTIMADRGYPPRGYKSACSYGSCVAYTTIVLPLEQTVLNQKIKDLLDSISQKGSKAKKLTGDYRGSINQTHQDIADLQKQLADCITGN